MTTNSYQNETSSGHNTLTNPEKNVPDRYYTPQPAPRRTSTHMQNYIPTPDPETVVVQKNGIVSDKYPCCLGCLLACFFCCMVKNESADFNEKN